MKYTNQTDKYKGLIEEDSNVGFYLHVYDVNSEKCLFDFLQETLEIAMDQAQEDFSFDKNSWKKLKE